MAKIVIECSDPNDLAAVEAATDQFQGKCNVTYFRQAQAMVKAGAASSLHDASKKIAEDTGETLPTVRHRVQRGEKIAQGGQPQLTPESSNEKQENQVTNEPQHGGIREGAGRPGKYEDDSDALFNLKRWWKKATKKDHSAFLNWIREEKKS